MTCSLRMYSSKSVPHHSQLVSDWILDAINLVSLVLARCAQRAPACICALPDPAVSKPLKSHLLHETSRRHSQPCAVALSLSERCRRIASVICPTPAGLQLLSRRRIWSRWDRTAVLL